MSTCCCPATHLLTCSPIAHPPTHPPTLPAGFPAKRPYAEFVDHYWPIAPGLLHSEEDDRVIAEGILKKTSTEGFQLGETKVCVWGGGGSSCRQQQGLVLVQCQDQLDAQGASPCMTAWGGHNQQHLAANGCFEMALP
jgi:hypothetical protein